MLLRLNEVFDAFDMDMDGFLTLSEGRCAVLAGGIIMSNADLDNIIKDFDAAGTGELERNKGSYLLHLLSFLLHSFTKSCRPGFIDMSQYFVLMARLFRDNPDTEAKLAFSVCSLGASKKAKEEVKEIFKLQKSSPGGILGLTRTMSTIQRRENDVVSDLTNMDDVLLSKHDLKGKLLTYGPHPLKEEDVAIFLDTLQDKGGVKTDDVGYIHIMNTIKLLKAEINWDEPSDTLGSRSGLGVGDAGGGEEEEDEEEEDEGQDG